MYSFFLKLFLQSSFVFSLGKWCEKSTFFSPILLTTACFFLFWKIVFFKGIFVCSTNERFGVLGIFNFFSKWEYCRKRTFLCPLSFIYPISYMACSSVHALVVHLFFLCKNKFTCFYLTSWDRLKGKALQIDLLKFGCWKKFCQGNLSDAESFPPSSSSSTLSLSFFWSLFLSLSFERLLILLAHNRLPMIFI